MAGIHPTTMKGRGPMRLFYNRSTKVRVKVLATTSLLAFLSYGLLAEDLVTPTPTPTPGYRRHPPRQGSVRLMEQLARRRALEADAQAKGDARAQANATRLSTAKAKADAKAARDRERAQRQADADARLKAKEKPRPTSDLMKRMGFSEQDIAAQKALEESLKPGAAPAASPAKAAQEKSASASPAPSPGSRTR